MHVSSRSVMVVGEERGRGYPSRQAGSVVGAHAALVGGAGVEGRRRRRGGGSDGDPSVVRRGLGWDGRSCGLSLVDLRLVGAEWCWDGGLAGV